MTDRDGLTERGRSLEDDYFRKQDQALIEKLRDAAAADRARAERGQARAELGQKLGITDPELLQELEARGFTPDTVVLLPLVPAVQIAWADGGISAAEGELIAKIARGRGVQAGSAADQTLSLWLNSRPPEQLFKNATRLIRAMLASSVASDLTADDLVEHWEAIAAASGGFLGLNRISPEERQLLTELSRELKAR